MTLLLVDIHCHLLPGLDDGPRDWEESLAMARLAVEDGTTLIIATPHQLGQFVANRGDNIRARVAELQQRLDANEIALRVLPGAEVRIEPGMIDGIVHGDVLTLAARSRHVLLELPQEIYLPIKPLLDDLSRRQIVGILAHPERNHGILRRLEIVAPLVDRGCLIQITAGSLCGTFGGESQQAAEWLIREGLVHFVASDGHGCRSRRPLLRRAYDRVAAITDQPTADELFCHNPAQVANGQPVHPGRRFQTGRPRRWWRRRAAV